MEDDELEAEYWGYSQYDYYDEEDDYRDDYDDFEDDREDYEVYHCPICDASNYETCSVVLHEIHDNAANALDPQLDYYPCGRCGNILRFHSRCDPDEFLIQEHALAVCHPCGEMHTVLHTTDTRRIIAVYLGLGGAYEGHWQDQKEEDLGDFGLPF